MPSKSLKQHQLMLAVSKDSDLAEKLNIDQKVAKEFIEKDREAGLYEDASLESFDGTALESDELEELIPSDEELESMNSGDASSRTAEDDGDGPCWPSHEQVGMKQKDGKTVPNCVPKESMEEEYSEESHSDPVKPFRFDDRFKG